MFNLKDKILKVIPDNIDIGFYLYDSYTKKSVSINGDIMFPIASITKFIIPAILLKEEFDICHEDVINCISKHSKKSYNTLISKCTVKEINTMLQDLSINIKVAKDNSDVIRNIGSPKSLVDFLKFIFDEENLNIEYRDLLFNSLCSQSDNDGFRFFEKGIWAHMTGGLEGVCNDLGILKLEDRKLYIVGLLITKDPSITWEVQEILLCRIGRIIKEIYAEVH
ncbi:serine hydrolase [Mangrovibacillus cuniculi]|uniref:Serine hydrolase n=1 Tax=Mangrovibacillus cuniculi TaxID=2593652 RepID=A0A7S8CDY5_9BACI|nr:serine hydrolase [Mangrovibacillus cuniculi]QPC48227.1 serine hydrolase [Mangrovibacillus cuniculi]